MFSDGLLNPVLTLPLTIHTVSEKHKTLSFCLHIFQLNMHYRHVVSDLLQSSQWPTLLRQSWEETTPFRELIKKMPGRVKLIFLIG